MFGFHFQRAVRDWPRAVALLPSGTWIKSVDSVQLLSEAKGVNPGIKTVLRHWYDGGQQFDGDNDKRAREFLASFVDETFRQHAHNVDAIEGFNEYWTYDIFADRYGHPASEIADRVRWAESLSRIWATEYKTQSEYAHIRLVISNSPVGNDVPLSVARIIANHGNILGYHPYYQVRDGVVSSDSWRWLSGRWSYADEVYRNAGVVVDYLFTEAGATWQNDAGRPDPNTGWRDSRVFGHNIDAYLASMKDWMDRVSEWNRNHNGRALGAVLFTTNNNADLKWRSYEIAQPEMDTIAQFMKDYSPGTVEPPPPDNLDKRIWNDSVQNQIDHGLSLNPNAGLQRAIFSHAGDFTPVDSERRLEGHAYQAAEDIKSGERLVFAVEVPAPGKPWGTPRVIEDPVKKNSD